MGAIFSNVVNNPLDTEVRKLKSGISQNRQIWTATQASMRERTVNDKQKSRQWFMTTEDWIRDHTMAASANTCDHEIDETEEWHKVTGLVRKNQRTCAVFGKILETFFDDEIQE